jgi:hypothetical protein
MKRFVLLYRGRGAPPESDRRRIESVRALRVVEAESPRLLLVEAPEQALREVVAELPHWTIGEERELTAGSA